jgi:hypothetical protein
VKLVRVKIRTADSTSRTSRTTDSMPRFIRSFKERQHVPMTETYCLASECSRMISVSRTAFGNERAGLTTGGLLLVGTRVFAPSASCSPAVGHTGCMILGAVTVRVKWPDRDIDH